MKPNETLQNEINLDKTDNNHRLFNKAQYNWVKLSQTQ